MLVNHTLGEGGGIWDDDSREKAGLDPIGKADWSWFKPFSWLQDGAEWIVGKLASFIFGVAGAIVEQFPQPLKFMFQNIGWIILGLLIVRLLGFLMEWGIL